MQDQAAQPEALTPEQHWNLQCHGVHQANEGITRTRNSGLRYIRRLIAGKVTSDSARQFTAAKLAAALKPIALPKFPSPQRAPRTAPTTPRKPANNDRHPDYAHCVEAVNHVNPVNFVDFAPAPPLAPLPPEPPKPIDPAEIPDLTAQVAKLEDLLAAHLRQLGWDRTGSTVAENPATREYLRNRADDTEFRYLPDLRQELAETKDRLQQSIALRDSLGASNATAITPAATDTTAALNFIIALSAEVAEASDKLRKIESAAASSNDPAEKLYLANLAAEISRDDLNPAQQQLAAAQAIIDHAPPTPSPATATAPTAAEPSPAPAAEPAPADPEAIAREAASLKAEWATLEDLRFGIGNELIALQRRKRHESHTPAWAAQAQDLFDRCVREKLDPTVMRQYTISQRLAQLGHKLE
jgi:hypothetical protein